MSKITRLYLWSFCVLTLLFPACQFNVDPTEDEEPPLAPITSYETGIFVTNQGNPQDGTTGSVSFYERSSGRVINDIYQKENDSKVLGSNVLQVSVFDKLAYIVVEDADKLEVVNAKSFQAIGAIGGFEQPQYFLPLNEEKAYVSQWGSDGLTGSIEVIDLKERTIVKSIPTRSGPTKMVRKGNFVYLANQGGLVVDSTISKIDISSDRVIKTINVGLTPNSLQVDQNNQLWVLTKGIVNQFDPSQSKAGKLSHIIGDAVRSSIELAPGAGNLTINRRGDQLFFVNNGWIYEMSILDTELPSNPFLNKGYTALGIDPATGYLVAANPKNLQVAGEVLIFDQTAAELDNFAVGVFPNYFWFE